MRTPALDKSLVERMKAGDSSAVADLSAAYGSQINQLALRYMKNKDDAEEVTQDVLMKVYRKIGAFRGDAALSSWIYRITFNTAMSRLRNGRNVRPAEVWRADRSQPGEQPARSERDVADWSSLADEQYLRAQMRKRLLAALTQLPSIYRMPVILRDVQGLSTQEASAVLRVKPQTLKSRLHRGRLSLRDALSDFAEGVTLHRAA
jgi:RNA polymerase sigma-70 factor (ECF subfamily)